MRILVIIAFLACAVAALRLGHGVRRRSGQVNWLPDAVRALSRARDRRAIADVLADRLAAALDVGYVEWWQRDEDGMYRSREGRFTGPEAGLLDRWITSGGTWRRSAASTPEAACLLADTAAEIAIPLGGVTDGRTPRPTSPPSKRSPII
jgi:hypothetical protein